MDLCQQVLLCPQLRETKDQLSEAERKESDAVLQARSLAKELESAEGEVSQGRADLKLAFKRIADLQNAMQVRKRVRRIGGSGSGH